MKAFTLTQGRRRLRRNTKKCSIRLDYPGDH